jgi:hypothetical protein
MPNVLSGVVNEAIQEQMQQFILPLFPWIAFGFIMVLANWRFDVELWLAQKDRKAEDRPRFIRYVNKIINCIFIILLAGCLQMATSTADGVDFISTTALVIWSATEFSRCLNKYMKIEGVNKNFNLLDLFRRIKMPELDNADSEDGKFITVIKKEETESNDTTT